MIWVRTLWAALFVTLALLSVPGPLSALELWSEAEARPPGRHSVDCLADTTECQTLLRACWQFGKASNSQSIISSLLK